MGQFDVLQGKLFSDQLCVSIEHLVCPSRAKLLLMGGRKTIFDSTIFDSKILNLATINNLKIQNVLFQGNL